MRNLIKANHLIEEIARKYKEITPITQKDEELFSKFFKTEPHTYGNSWTYVTQGMYGIGPYGLGYKYYDGNNLSAIAVYPKIENPATHCFYWVRPIGRQILDVILSLSSDILKDYSMPTYTKKIYREQFYYLNKKGFKDTKKFPWHSSCPSEDDTYPEQIIDAEKTLKIIETLPKSKYVKKINLRAENLQKRYGIEINNSSFKSNALTVAKRFFNSKTMKKKKINLSTEYDYYNMIFANKDRETLVKNVIYIKEKPVGFYLMEQLDYLYTSIYALIVLRDKIKFLADYTFLYILNNLKTPYLNTGGSEDEGIHQFKKKYYPQREQQMYWATNYVS